jgi:hypothetical protein
MKELASDFPLMFSSNLLGTRDSLKGLANCGPCIICTYKNTFSSEICML